MSKKTVKKFIFSLSIVNLKELHAKYQLNIPNIESTKIEVPDLSYYDEIKKLHRCILSKIDLTNKEGKYHCFWDHHTFSGPAIGCPVAYKADYVSRAYFSEITKEKFFVRESIQRDKVLDENVEFHKETAEYFETEGIFCSPNCLLAFIIENKRNYPESELLFYKMMSRIGKEEINPAPSWRLLIEYGGHLDIDAFRDSFSNIEYDYKGIYKLPTKQIFHSFEERYKI